MTCTHEPHPCDIRPPPARRAARARSSPKNRDGAAPDTATIAVIASSPGYAVVGKASRRYHDCTSTAHGTRWSAHTHPIHPGEIPHTQAHRCANGERGREKPPIGLRIPLRVVLLQTQTLTRHMYRTHSAETETLTDKKHTYQHQHIRTHQHADTHTHIKCTQRHDTRSPSER